MTRRALVVLAAALALLVVTGCANDDDRVELERLSAQVAALEAAQTTTTTAADWQAEAIAAVDHQSVALDYLDTARATRDFGAVVNALITATAWARAEANALEHACPAAAAAARSAAADLERAWKAFVGAFAVVDDWARANADLDRWLDRWLDHRAEVLDAGEPCVERDRARQ